MSTLRFAVWNMEWMNDLFGPNDEPPAFRADDDHPFHNQGATIRARRDDLAGVLSEVDPEVLVVVEGPNRAGELQLFFDEDVDGEWTIQVQHSKGQSQNIGIAVRTDTGKFDDPPFKYFDTANLEAFDPFAVDTDDDEIDENYHFERRPLYVEIHPVEGPVFRVLGLHLKSKGIFKAYEWSRWWAHADANRRKILAQVTQLRLRFLAPYFADPQTAGIPLIVCGDINDGPGLDASEKRLFGSAVERLMGTVWRPDLILRNALFDTLDQRDQDELNFEDLSTTSFKDPIFNNVWHRVWIDHVLYSTNAPADWVSEAEIHYLMADERPIWEAFPHASDHFPVSVRVDLEG